MNKKQKKELLAALKNAAIAAESYGREHDAKHYNSRDPFLIGTLAAIIGPIVGESYQTILEALRCSNVTEEELTEYRRVEAARAAAWEADRPARELRLAEYRARVV